MTTTPKYELIPDAASGLFRVRALRRIPSRGVVRGALGGLVAGPDNLSQAGLCWVTADAWITGAAVVCGDALVTGRAVVTDNALVTDRARVTAAAQVTAWARVTGDALVTDRAVVTGDALVTDRAVVTGRATVSGTATVAGDAVVSGAAVVTGTGWAAGTAGVYGDARVSRRRHVFTASGVGSEHGTLTVTPGARGLVVTRGCFTGTSAEFLRASATKHDERVRREYEMLLQVAESIIGREG